MDLDRARFAAMIPRNSSRFDQIPAMQYAPAIQSSVFISVGSVEGREGWTHSSSPRWKFPVMLL